jgi:hypothetical protein
MTAGFDNMDERVKAKFAKLMTDPILLAQFKSVEQGAATQVLAAVGSAFEGVGGIYLDDCGVSQPVKGGGPIALSGYSS